MVKRRQQPLPLAPPPTTCASNNESQNQRCTPTTTSRSCPHPLAIRLWRCVVHAGCAHGFRATRSFLGKSAFRTSTLPHDACVSVLLRFPWERAVRCQPLCTDTHTAKKSTRESHKDHWPTHRHYHVKSSRIRETTNQHIGKCILLNVDIFFIPNA
jgi:hypothetical protein